MTTKNKPNGSYTTHGPNCDPVPPTSQRGSINPQDAPGTPARKIFTRASHNEYGKAGSVDASVFSVADSASPAVSTDRKATADLAEPAAGKQSLGTEAASAPVYSERSRRGAAMSQMLQREAPRTEAPMVPMAQGAT